MGGDLRRRIRGIRSAARSYAAGSPTLQWLRAQPARDVVRGRARAVVHAALPRTRAHAARRLGPGLLPRGRAVGGDPEGARTAAGVDPEPARARVGAGRVEPVRAAHPARDLGRAVGCQHPAVRADMGPARLGDGARRQPRPQAGRHPRVLRAGGFDRYRVDLLRPAQPVRRARLAQPRRGRPRGAARVDRRAQRDRRDVDVPDRRPRPARARRPPRHPAVAGHARPTVRADRVRRPSQSSR